MAREAFSNHRSRRYIERREQGQSAMSGVVIAASLGLSRTHRQDRLGPVQRLDLALFIDTKHQGFFGGRHVEPNDVAYLFDKQRVRRKLEGFDTVWLQAECLPNAVDRRGRM